RLFRPLEDVGRIDVLQVERRVLAHQHHVELAEGALVLAFEAEPALEVVPDGDGPGAREGLAPPQPEIRLLHVVDLGPPPGRFEEHRERAVLLRVDRFDRVHDDPDPQAFSCHAGVLPRAPDALCGNSAAGCVSAPGDPREAGQNAIESGRFRRVPVVMAALNSMWYKGRHSAWGAR